MVHCIMDVMNVHVYIICDSLDVLCSVQVLVLTHCVMSTRHRFDPAMTIAQGTLYSHGSFAVHVFV